MFSAYGIHTLKNEKLRVSDGYLLLTGLQDYLFSIFISLHSHKLVLDWFNDPDITTSTTWSFLSPDQNGCNTRRIFMSFSIKFAKPAICNIDAKMATSQESYYYFYCKQNRISHSCRLKFYSSAFLLNQLTLSSGVQLSLRQTNRKADCTSPSLEQCFPSGPSQ